MVRLLLLLLLLYPAAALATGPQLYLVSDVAPGDVLNVRAAPSADAADIGDLAPDGPGVAVLERDESGAWAHIEWRGGSGWVSMRHLRPAFADGPQLFRVTGVPAGDVLTVRTEPSAASADIGEVGGDGALVEVLGAGPEARWGQVVHGEGNGWVALRYLAPVEPARVGPSPIPVGLFCSGTEPFWSLRITGPDRLTFAEPGEGAEPLEDDARIAWAAQASGRSGFPAALRAAGETGDYALLLRPAACSDGMSDRLYGWTADVLAGDRLLTGCCRTAAVE